MYGTNAIRTDSRCLDPGFLRVHPDTVGFYGSSLARTVETPQRAIPFNALQVAGVYFACSVQ